ncbi:MAG: translation initiation factor IF-2 [Ruminococcus sp.]|jgi:translation initiation factor IF-2|nr:translation initiation factor IF-2 [Ruminococcus sp.]
MTQKQPKTKISETAKDLKLPVQEILDFFKNSVGEEKKSSGTFTNEEVNLVLEHFTSVNQVESFDEFFSVRQKAEKTTKAEAALKSLKAIIPIPKLKPHKPEKPEQPKKTPETAKTVSPRVKKAAVKAEVQPKPKAETVKPVPRQTVNLPVHPNLDVSANLMRQREAEAAKKAAETKQAAKKAAESAARKPESATSAKNNIRNERFNAAQVLSKQNEKKKPEKTKNSEVHSKQNQTKLNVGLADSSTVDKKIHAVDTRGTYVEIDKYNERYDNIAPASIGGKKNDNFKNKQKIVQKSQQRKSQQFSNKHETEAQKMKRLELERARKQQLKVLIPNEIVVSELAARLKVTATQVIKTLMKLGEMVTINQVIDFDTASLVAEELGAKVEKEVILTIEERLIDDSDDTEGGVERPPVVVVMGHVDHGKTSLLDYIRHTSVTSTEAGGITQHIGAYMVEVDGKKITFLDTPGHAAFTSMRARGASVTDIAILVVAADDGIMPQTIEAINHAKAANVPIIVAINKMDKEAAKPDVIKQQLTEHGLVIEEWGGDVICVPVSAKTGMGIEDLLEQILVVAEVAELKANPNRPAKGAVIEARLDKGRGPIATILIQSGTLHTGDVIIAGTAVGRVRVMTNDKGEIVKEAFPSQPVEITGLAEVPAAGDIFNAVADERLARELVEERRHNQKQEQFAQYQKVTLDNLFSQIEQGNIKELPIIVKADVQGSVEAVKQSLEKLTNEEVRVRVIHGAVGAISESDVMLADASNAIIVGFNVRPDPVAEDSAKRDGVELRLYRIIYDAIEEVQTAMKGMLAPKYREVNFGRAEVRQVYKITNVGMVAGCYVVSGKIARNNEIRVVRDGIIIATDKIGSLKRFKDDVKDVAEGYECGITLDKFTDVKVGDMLEGFITEEYRAD